MRTDYQRRYKDIEMTQNDRTIAKYLTVDLMTGWAINACEDKNRGIVPKTRSFLNVYIANFNNWFLTLKKGLYEMRTYHKQCDKNIETLRLDRLTPT